MGIRARMVVILGSLLLTLARPSLADIIHLTNGGEIRGTVISRSGGVVKIQTPRGVITVKASDILRIEVETGTDRLLSEARQLASSNKMSEAMDKLSEAEREGANPKDVQRLRIKFIVNAAQRLEAEGRLTEALKYYSAALKAAPDDRTLQQGAARVERALNQVAGGVEEARRALASGHAVRAVEVLERSAARTPAIRKSLGELMAMAYVQAAQEVSIRDDKRALVYFNKAVRALPEMEKRIRDLMISTRYRAIQSLRVDGEVDEALARSEALMRDAPGVSFVTFQYAVLLMAKGRRPEAREQMLSILPKNERDGTKYPGTKGFNTIVNKAEKIVHEDLKAYSKPIDLEKEKRAKVDERKNQKLNGNLFVVHHRNLELAREVLAVAEAHTLKIMNKLKRGGKRPWSGRCKILLMPDRATYLEETGMPEWSAGAAHTEMLGNGLVMRHISLYQTSANLVKKTVPHEVAHLVFNALISYRRQIPLAIHEGVAVSLEPEYTTRRDSPLLLWSRLTGELIPLRELFVKKRIADRDAKLFYPQSASVVSFLLKLKGWETFLEFVPDLASEGASTAIRRRYDFESLAELEKAWLDSIGK